MKNLLTLLLFAILALLSENAAATNYYFSSTDGDDSRTSAEAQNSSTPWKTINKLNSIFSSLQPGDQILFKRGDIFYGSIIATKAGTSAQHIIFSAYGSGAKPIITGFTPVASWTNTGNNIWQSTSAVSTLGTTNIVAVNGVNTGMGRTPNTGSYYSISSHSGSSSVTISSLGSANYKGAEVVFRTGASWIMSRNLITSQSGSTLNYVRNFANPFNFTAYDAANGGQAFIQNALSTLDAQNEWYYDPSTKKLSIYSSGTPAGVKIATIDSLVKLTAGSITFDNLDFEGANTDCFQLNGATDITIQSCDIQYCGDKGVDQMNNNPNLKVLNCTFRDIQNSGITNIGYSNNGGMTISGNSFVNINMIPGAWGSLDGANLVIGIYDNGTNDVIQNNSIDSCGYSGIFEMGQSFTVQNNFVNHYCFYNTDGGGIYTGNHGTARKIIGNIVLNGVTSLAQGIYVDDNGSNVTITGNTVSKANLGIYLHNAHEITVQTNTVYNCSGASLSMGHDANDAVRNVSVSQNIFVLAASVSQGNCSYQTSETSQTNFGSSDNNYICKPLGTDDNAWFTALQGSSFNHYTLAQWQSMSSFDKSSKKSPKTISDAKDLRFEYNATASSKTINLGASYMDATGKNFAGSITLAPYSSAVLIYVSGTIANQPPVSSAGPDQNLSLPTNTTTLTGSSTDPDGTITAYQWTKISGPTQSTISSPTLAKTSVSSLTEGVYQFELKVTDNSGATDKDTVSVTVNASSNQPPVAKAGNSQSITLPTNSVSVDGSSSTDPDGTIASYQWTKILGPSSAVIVAPNLASTNITSLTQGVYQFELRVTDNLGAMGKDTIQITVGGAPNQSPTANAGLDINITLPTNSVTLSGSGSDNDGTISAYQWSKISGPSQYNISSPTKGQTTVNNLVEGTYQFQLTVTDNSGATDNDIVQITVNPSAVPNQPPSADAGLNINITLPTNSVTLSGSGSDNDGTISAYQWSKISGPSQYNISSPTKGQTTVNNLVEGTYQFQLTVTDNSGATDNDIVQITVNPSPVPNQPPSADAGLNINITLPTNSVTLSGSGNDNDGTISSYQWSKISGPSQYNISSPTKGQTTVNNLAEGIYQFQLTVTDDAGATATDIVQVTVNAAPNQLPIADAGADIVITLPTNNTILSGSGDDLDGNIVSYQWTKISGPSQYTIALPTRTKTTIDNLTEGIYQFELKVTDNSGAIATDIVQVTVNAAPQQPNQDPKANAGPDLTITLPVNNVTLNGTGNDPDGNIASYQWTMVSGPSQYDIASATQGRTSVNNLAKGVYEFELQVTDNSGATDLDVVQITVNAGAPPPNQSPSADAGADVIITLPTNSTTLLGGGTDPDGTIASYQWTKTAGPSQYNIVSPGTDQTSITNLAQGVYTFELMVTDNLGATATDIVQIFVNAAPNQSPTVDAGADISITLPTNNTTLSGTGADADGWMSSYQWKKISGPSQYNMASPNSVQTSVNNLTQGAYAFELMAMDNSGATAKDTVQIFVNAAPNQSPAADAGSDLNITLPTNSITLSGTGVDPDGTIASYKWTKIGGPTQYNIASTTLAKTGVTNLAQGTYDFELTVTDNSGASSKDTVEVTVNAAVAKPNQGPDANAGSDVQITLPTNSARLSGRGVDPDGQIASYRWRSVSGPKEFTILSPTRSLTTVNNLVKGVYNFELTVTDNSGGTDKDTVQVTVLAAPPNKPPTANAGIDKNLTLPTNSTSLSGSGSDPDGTVSSYQWKKISGPSQYNISSSTKAQATASSLVQGTYKFELTVTDNSGASAKDTMQVTVNAAPINQSPTANAGSDISIILPTNSITLSGTGNDPDGTIASYQWRKISGPSQYNIVSSTKAQTSVNNLAKGVYQFEFTVTDNSGKSAKDTVQVTVSAQASPAAPPNQAPIASAGLDINITLPTNSVILSGNGTDVDGTIASYQWNKISGPSQYSIVSATQAKTTVNNLVEGIYKFELIVTDNSGLSAKDTMQVIVNPVALPANQSPMANTGANLEITLPTDSVQLSGKGSDMDGTIASYKWRKISGPTQFNIVSSTNAQTVVNDLAQGVYQFELTVTDNSNGSGKDTIQVTVNAAPNQSPIAKAGSDLQISLPTDTTTLTGAGTDPDGTIASYKWTKISGPVQPTLASPSKAKTLISNLAEGVYQFELTVTDNSGASAKDTVEVIVLAVPKAFAKVFPNPATSVVNFQIEGATTTSSSTALRIYDNKGILVYQEDFVRPRQPMIKQVNVSKLPGGIYFAELQTGTSNITTLRFMKK